MGYDLTIAGHTHGGQVRVEILREDLNIARFFTPYVDGLYRRTAHRRFLFRAASGPSCCRPALGSTPEVALLRLRLEGATCACEWPFDPQRHPRQP